MLGNTEKQAQDSGKHIAKGSYICVCNPFTPCTSWGAGLPNKQNKADKVLFIKCGDITSWGFFYSIATTDHQFF
jgi:hypothetical protein